MQFKLCISIFSALCLVHALGSPHVTRDLAADVEHTEYATTRLASEAAVLAERFAIIQQEVNYTVANAYLQVEEKLAALQLDQATLEALHGDITKHLSKISASVTRVTDLLDELMRLVIQIHVDLHNDVARLRLDLVLLNNSDKNVELAYSAGLDNVALSTHYLQLRIDQVLEGQSGVEVEEARALARYANAVLLAERDHTAATKVLYDAALVLAHDSLQVIVLQL